MYRACIQSVLTYGTETWAMKAENLQSGESHLHNDQWPTSHGPCTNKIKVHARQNFTTKQQKTKTKQKRTKKFSVSV